MPVPTDAYADPMAVHLTRTDYVGDEVADLDCKAKIMRWPDSYTIALGATTTSTVRQKPAIYAQATATTRDAESVL